MSGADAASPVAAHLEGMKPISEQQPRSTVLAAVVAHVESTWLAVDAPALLRRGLAHHLDATLRVVEVAGHAIAYNADRHGEDAYVIDIATGRVTTVSGYLSPSAMVAVATRAAA